jgi:flagellar hook-associated protein 1 FlgK
VLVTDPTKVAAAAPIRSAVAFANKGGATVSAGEVLDATQPQLRDTVNIAFTSSNTYTLNGTGSYTLPPSGIIAVNGWMVQLSGTPATGDGFVVQANTGGTGDNRNALELARVLDAGLLSGGSESLNGAVSRMVGGIGVATNQAQNGRDTQKLILDDTTSARDGVQGVNLDEEAANMMRFQQAYQATAQVIKATQTLFDTLLQATR